MAGKHCLKTAAAFGAAPEILPYIPELLADLWSLGIPADTLVELLGDLDLEDDMVRVIDLGCGKGANSITLARQFKFHAHGIDLFEPFIIEARERALELGVADLCRFEPGDMEETVRDLRGYDMVLLIWVGGVLGDIGESMGRIRQLIRPGGYMVIGEGYLKDGAITDHPFLERFDYRDKVLEKLGMHGDTLVREKGITANRLHHFHNDYIYSLRKGARKCSQKHPEHSRILWDYVNSHEKMCRIMENAVESCLWLMRKDREQ